MDQRLGIRPPGITTLPGSGHDLQPGTPAPLAPATGESPARSLGGAWMNDSRPGLLAASRLLLGRPGRQRGSAGSSSAGCSGQGSSARRSRTRSLSAARMSSSAGVNRSTKCRRTSSTCWGLRPRWRGARRAGGRSWRCGRRRDWVRGRPDLAPACAGPGGRAGSSPTAARRTVPARASGPWDAPRVRRGSRSRPPSARSPAAGAGSGARPAGRCAWMKVRQARSSRGSSHFGSVGMAHTTLWLIHQPKALWLMTSTSHLHQEEP